MFTYRILARCYRHAGVETRTSAPVQIVRDPTTLQCESCEGLFPAGEGAGYAGGIVSAACDGVRIGKAVIASLAVSASRSGSPVADMVAQIGEAAEDISQLTLKKPLY